MLDVNYNPDVLTCLANLSNDEVFTPPTVVNDMLDLLPQSIWHDERATFLDPVTKSGVFLREIAKRLMEGLKEKIPDQQERINHIFTHQLYGIAITELTGLLARRSLYCSKKANSKYSICETFTTEQGNIRFDRMEHTWHKGKCIYCGASQEVYDRADILETHAYAFIHTENPEEIFDMRFDVIIGNPPYQLGDGGNNASATPIYNLFVNQAKKLNPRYLVMIIPARWYAGGRGLNSFRESMLKDNHLKEIHDFKNTEDCFPGIRVGGGICYFLWEKDYNSSDVVVYSHEKNIVVNCTKRPKLEANLKIFIRDSIVATIIQKIAKLSNKRMSSMVLSQKPYGFRTNFMNFQERGEIKLYTKKTKSGFAYVSLSDITKNRESIADWKVVTSRSTSVPEEDNGQVLRMSQTFIVEPMAVVTESYVVIATFKSKQKALNCMSYVKTKFFRLLCQITIVSPDVSARTFDLVPLESFDEYWTDEKLYKKYSLNDDEIAFVEKTIKTVE